MNTSPVSLPRLLPVWAGVLLAAFSGILMACAFIPVDWGGCVWIGFLPLLTALWYGRRREGKKGILAYALYGWVFGVVWPILYGLQGLALAMILDARGATGRGIAIGLFGLQFLLNLIWSPIFFARHDVSLAFWIILAMFIIATAATFCFWRIRRMAGLLMLPYLIWLCFAAFLNFSIGQLNPDAEKLHNPVARTHIGKATN